MKQKKQHTVETLTQLGFDQTRVIASKTIFVRNAGAGGEVFWLGCLIMVNHPDLILLGGSERALSNQVPGIP